MNQKILLLVNPSSGLRRVVPMLPQIVNAFADAGYETRIHLSSHRGDIRRLAEVYGAEADYVVCAGGDGTLNEMISGMISAGHTTPIGYIPAGTTNDLAKSLGLSSDILTAVGDIINGVAMPLDVGRMNGRYFVYTASFGVFTRASYAAAQSMKNVLGHAAYVIEGMRDLTQIKTRHVRATAGDVVVEGDMLFGSISNSTSLGGVLRIAPELVSLNDGKFELIMLEKPKNVTGYYPMIESLVNQHYQNENVHLINASHVHLEMPEDTDWTLDGEFEKGTTSVDIENLHSAVQLMVKRTEEDIALDI